MKKLLTWVLMMGLLFVQAFSDDVFAQNNDAMEVSDRFKEICENIFEGEGYMVLTHDGVDITGFFTKEYENFYEGRDFDSLWNTVLRERYIITWATITPGQDEPAGARGYLLFHITQYYYWLRSENMFFLNQSYEALVSLSIDVTTLDGYNYIQSVSSPVLTLIHFGIGAYYEHQMDVDYVTSYLASDHTSLSVYSRYRFAVTIYTNWFELMDDAWAQPELGETKYTQYFFSAFVVNGNGNITYCTGDDTP